VNGSWKYRPPVLAPRFAHEVATVGDDLFVLGGTDGDAVFGSVETRKVAGSGTWQYVSPMPTPRGHLAAGVAGGLVHAVAGITSDGRTTDVVEVYDPRADEWRAAPPLPVPLGAPAAAGLGGLLYVAGGFDPGEQATDAVFVFDPAGQHWAPVAPMRTPRARFRLVATATHLYAIGGQAGRPPNALASVERYRPDTGAWEEITPMHKRRGAPGAAPAGDRIVVVGGAPAPGDDPAARDRTTEVLDVGTGEWVLAGTLLPHGRSALACAATSGRRVLAVGGQANRYGSLVAVPDVRSLTLP
jgi:N-acetylneuraminic acid mutarotase